MLLLVWIGGWIYKWIESKKKYLILFFINVLKFIYITSWITLFYNNLKVLSLEAFNPPNARWRELHPAPSWITSFQSSQNFTTALGGWPCTSSRWMTTRTTTTATTTTTWWRQRRRSAWSAPSLGWRCGRWSPGTSWGSTPSTPTHRRSKILKLKPHKV